MSTINTHALLYETAAVKLVELKRKLLFTAVKIPIEAPNILTLLDM